MAGQRVLADGAPGRRSAARPGAARMIRFGFAAPPGDWETVRFDPTSFTADLDRLMDVAGPIFDLVWVSDHLMEGDRYRVEPWTQLTWLAARVPNVLLGHSVLANSYRHPALMARRCPPASRRSAVAGSSWVMELAGSRTSTGPTAIPLPVNT